MKFKKTKLTALAMSVLMAASTITSVTWAADLFTDGAPAEVVVEAPVDVEEAVPVAVEEVTDGSNETLLTATEGQIVGVKEIYFHYNTSKTAVVVDYQVVEDDGTGGTRDVGAKVLNQSTQVVSGTTVAADCENPERSIYAFTYTGPTGKETFSYQSNSNSSEVDIDSDIETTVTDAAGNEKTGYIKNPTSKELGHIWAENVTKVMEPATCTHLGYKYTYPGCEREKCKKYAPTKNTAASAYIEVTDDVAETYSSKFTKADIPKVKHNYKTTSVIITPQYIEEKDDLYTDVDLEQYRPVNCTWVDGKFVPNANDEAEKTENAYYYIAYECSVCGEPGEFDIVWLRDVDGTVEGTYYEASDNVLGFAKINSDGILEVVKFTDCTDGKIDVTKVNSNPVIPVLINCDRPGYYYKREYHKGDLKPVKSDRIEVKKGHAWGSAEVDLASDKTETTKLGYEKDGTTPLVERDALGNVIEAKSKDCITKAKYILYHKCLNEACVGKETVGDVKETSVNLDAHQFSGWTEEPDLDETTYTDSKDGLHHIKHLNVSQTCQLCFTKNIRPYENVEETHTLNDKKIEGTQVDATCGVPGTYQSALTCACGYMDEESITDVTIPATDKHDFGTNEAFIEWIGEAYIDGTGSKPAKRQFEARVVRKCNVCGLTDSNGVNGEVAGIRNEGTNVDIDVDYKSIVDAKKDPSTGLTYPCSTAHATIYVDWVGIVDGKAVKLSEKKENVPYYASLQEYQGRTAHQAGELKVENEVAATAEKEGSYDNVIYCRVCGDEMSRETVTVPKLDPEVQVAIPIVTATAVDYNTVNISWTPVEGATSYRLYYRSADLGITTWHRVRTLKGTSFTHSGLTTGARYRYTVRAEVNGKLGDYSRTGSVARPLPTAPEMKSVTAVSNGTKVTWSKVDGADGYIIFRKTTGAFTRVGAVSKGSKVTWTDRKPVSGATYKVRAYRTVNNVNYKGAFSAAK